MPSESRTLKLASQVSGRESSMLYRHLEESRVLITADDSTSMGRLAIRVLLTTLRRLPISLYLRSQDLPREFVGDLYERLLCIAPNRPLHLIEAEPEGKVLHVHVG